MFEMMMGCHSRGVRAKRVLLTVTGIVQCTILVPHVPRRMAWTVEEGARCFFSGDEDDLGWMKMIWGSTFGPSTVLLGPHSQSDGNECTVL